MSSDSFKTHPREIRQAITTRMVEERLLKLFSEGKLFGTVHTCIGQELVGVSVARALQPQDTIFSNHRGHGHYLARTGDVEGLIGEVMGKSTGVCRGRGGSQHLQRENYYSNGIQGGIAPVTVGLAMGQKIKQNNGISVVFIGDGTLGEGVLYEAMNIASKWELPVLFVCENNGFAQSTDQKQTLAGDICARAAAFGIATAHNDVWDMNSLFDAMAKSVETVRSTGKPLFHQVDSYRLMAHSKGDDNRPDAIVEPYRQRDPVNNLLAQYKDDPNWQAMIKEIAAQIETAVAKADAADWHACPPPSPWRKPQQYQWKKRSFEPEKGVASIRRGLGEAMKRDPRVVLLGEDIESPYGGAFKCTMGLSDQFPGRVRNTPISEAAIVGVSNGLALAGQRPVCEIMFGDFMTLACDQWINHAAKFRFMFDEKVTVPMIVRTPMGGRRGYAATHSQSIEKHFLGVPDTQVLCLHHRYSPAQLYLDLLQNIDRPTLVIENKLLYGQMCSTQPPPGYQIQYSDELFPTARLKPQAAPDVTMVAIGGMSPDAEQAMMRLFDEEEIVAELFLPTRLYPFSVDVLWESLEHTRRLIVIEEGQGFVSLSSELIAQVCERYGAGGLTCRRVCAQPCAIPAARPTEAQSLPGVDDIIANAREVLRELIH